jgi:hypothetical protein
VKLRKPPHIIVYSALTVIGLTVLCGEIEARRAIPDDNLAYPVLITLKGGAQGSGFFLNLQTATFLVTARHVLFKEGTDDLLAPAAEVRSYARDPSDKGKNIFQLDLATLKQGDNIKRHATHDVAIIRIGLRTHSTNQDADLHPLGTLDGVVIKETAASGILGVGESTIKRFAEVMTANDVFIFGFPTSIGLKAIPQIDYRRPLLRAGVVAGTNDQAQTIILDCPAYGGNSGGPVLEVEEDGFVKNFRIIGVVSQFVPVAETWRNITHGYNNTNISNSGYAIAVPMDFVLDLTREF